MEQEICLKCGRANPATAEWCKKCGTRLHPPEASKDQAGTETKAPVVSTGRRTFSPNATAATKVRGIIAIILGGLLTLAGLAWMVFEISRPDHFSLQSPLKGPLIVFFVGIEILYLGFTQENR
jgi:ribosomal protein L40E